jgi:50S ribosomal protein L16 3-hydroxylase
MGGFLDDDTEFEAFLGGFLSRYRLAHEPAPPDDPVTPDNLRHSLRAGHMLRHNPWTRLLWLESDGDTPLFAAGTAYPWPREFARGVCDPAQLARFGPDLPEADAERLCELLNRGHLYIESL